MCMEFKHDSRETNLSEKAQQNYPDLAREVGYRDAPGDPALVPRCVLLVHARSNSMGVSA